MSERGVMAVILSIALVVGICLAPGGAQEPKKDVTKSRIFLLPPAGAGFDITPAQLDRALFLETEAGAWQPAVHKTRGPALSVYTTAAPATVVVRTPSGHGTGVIVDPGGWILTNHHCVSWAPTDVATGAQVVTIHLGVIQDNLMRLSGDGLPGLVYKVSEEKDLALVKLTRLPEGVTALPTIGLAGDVPAPGSDCVAMGHPAAGMLWTIRSCEVINVGDWPDQQIDFVINLLGAASDEDRDRLRALASQMPRRRIVISSCGLNPGDSGGPLLNTSGELIGLTFAIPATDPSSEVSLDKFSYHVHLNEVNGFCAERPSEPLLNIPGPWPPARVSVQLDADQDEKAETLVFAMGPGLPFTGLMADLDENSLPVFNPKEHNPAEYKWDFEFAWQPEPEPRAFYDLNDDREFDLVLVDVDRDGKSDINLKLDGGKWSKVSEEGRKMQDESLVPRSTRKRFAALLEAMNKAGEEE